jgi:hypothetical protein
LNVKLVGASRNQKVKMPKSLANVINEKEMKCLLCDICINFGLERLKGLILLGLEIQTVDRAARYVQTVFAELTGLCTADST